jgi:large subunit ribosomal protein L22
MQVRSIYRDARISAFKCREVTREIQGLPVGAAVDLLNFTPKKAARLVLKTLKSAIANAENNNSLRAEKLIVQEAVVGEGTTIKRFRPKARGSAGPVRKRTSHIRIILSDDLENLPTKTRLKAVSRLPKEKAPRAKRTATGEKKKKAAKAAPESAPKAETTETTESAS